MGSHPRPRNAYSSPATNPSGSGDKSCVGDACYWYQVGCHIGCPSCTLEGKSLYPGPHCTKEQAIRITCATKGSAMRSQATAHWIRIRVRRHARRRTFLASSCKEMNQG